MKKIFLAIIAAAVALAFTACEPTTNVKWKTTYDPYTGAPSIEPEKDGITDIAWEKIDGSVDTGWNEQLLDADQETSSKTVGILTGYPTCLSDGLDATLVISDSSAGVKGPVSGGGLMLEEGADATLLIESAKKK